MPGNAQASDLLHLHANVSRRVRNLETGVHPTIAEAEYADVVPPTTIAITNPTVWTPWDAFGTTPAPPKWQRRFGVVTLIGGIHPNFGGGWPAVSGPESPVGTLPAGARPLSELVVICASDQPPFYTTVRVKPTGELSVIKPPAVDPGAGVRFDGATWTID